MAIAVVRTTVGFSRAFHRKLRMQAMEQGISIGEVIERKFRSGTRSINDDLALFEKARLSGRQIIARDAVREERDSH